MTPRCFGLPSLIHRDAPHCAECPHLNECERVALNKALALSAYIQIPDVIARLRNRDGQKGQPTAITGVSPMTRTTSGEKVRMALTEEDVATVKQMPVKVRRKVELLMKQGKDVAARKPFCGARTRFLLRGAGTCTSLAICCWQGASQGRSFARHTCNVLGGPRALRTLMCPQS